MGLVVGIVVESQVVPVSVALSPREKYIDSGFGFPVAGIKMLKPSTWKVVGV